MPSTDKQLDEQKDPYFLNGKAHVNTLNYTAAIDSFEKALETNPRSASAHFELGLLYEQKVSQENSAAIAIYHYHRFLQLRPASEHAEIVRQKILSCKQEIAKPIALSPGTQSVLKDLERLRVENAQMRSQLEAWQYAATNRSGLPPTGFAPPPTGLRPGPPAAGSPATALRAPAPGYPAPNLAGTVPGTPPPVSPAGPRKHEVKAGETPAGIARRYNVGLNALMAANPGVDARRLKVGQSINIPTPPANRP